MFFALSVLFALVALLFAVLVFVDQRALYWRLAAWRHRDPAANEPSDARYAFGRVGWAVLALLFAVGAVQTWDSGDVTSFSEGEARAIVDTAASRLEEEPHLRSPSTENFEYTVEDAVRTAASEDDTALQVTTSLAKGESSGEVERYTVSMDGSEYRFCLSVTASESEEGGVSVPGVDGQQGTTTPAYDLSSKVVKGGCGAG